MSTPVPVGIVGATGFLGGELVRLLQRHPRVRISALCSGRTAGQPLSAVRAGLAHPALPQLERPDPAALVDRCRVVFLALPHGESARLGAALYARGGTVIDLGSDFRLRDPADHQTYYGRDPQAPDLLDRAVYSLPELTGSLPPDTRLIANPGCFATAMALGLAPLAPALAKGARVQVFGATGSSGSGISPRAGVHHSLRMTSFVAYKALRHQHMGELRQLLARRGAVPDIAFVPHSLPLARGIHLTITLPSDQLTGDPQALLEAAYADAPLVQIGQGPVALGAVIGSCRVHIGLCASGSTTVIFVAIDNLLKGGSGQAVQNLNLLMGWDPLTGIPQLGSWP